MPADLFHFTSVVRPGDVISFGQACSEPTGLVRQFAAQAPEIHRVAGKMKLFVAGSFSGILRPELGEWFDFAGYGAMGDGAALARAGRLQVYPVHYSRIPQLLADVLRPQVVFLQLSAPDAQGRHSLGIANDFQLATARRARVVIAEFNASVPFSPSALVPHDLRIDHVISSDEPLVEVASGTGGETVERLAQHVAALIPDSATLQMGVGSIMDAVCRALRSHRHLGIHTGVITDGLADLMRCGAVTNERKGTHTGTSVAGSLLGSRRLFQFADRNQAIRLEETDVTHSQGSLAGIRRFCAINSAVEIDLTGQVNAEVSAGRYIGAVGGQVDFLRAAANSDQGLSIIALPSTAGGGKFSRIVSTLNGPVTTPRCDVDYVVTEWGAARLTGLSLDRRAAALAAIAHPDYREALLHGSASQKDS
jgi:acyl-CoA hydrolase